MPAANRNLSGKFERDARAALLSAMMLIASILFIDTRSVLSVALSVIILSVFAAMLQISARAIVRPLILAFIMILAISWPLLLSARGADDQILVRFWIIRIPQAAFLRFLDMNIRLILISAITIILREGTYSPKMIQTLHGFGLPHWLLAILTQMYRLMFLLADELVRMRRAFISRATHLTPGIRFKATAGMTGVYFARIIERSDRTFSAMVSRGFNGHFPQLSDAVWKFRDTLLTMVCGIYLIWVVLWL